MVYFSYSFLQNKSTVSLVIYHLPQAFTTADEAFRIDYIALLHCILHIRCFLGNDFAVFIKDHLVEVPCQYESEKVAADK